MNGNLLELGDERALMARADGPVVRDGDDARSLIEEAMSERATMIVVPAERLDPAFFQLRSGIAGGVLQKAMNYKLKFAVIGDISQHVAASDALRDFVIECNRGREILFVPDLPALTKRFASPG